MPEKTGLPASYVAGYDEEWSDVTWLPRVLRGGFKYWAIVLPSAAIGSSTCVG